MVQEHRSGVSVTRSCVVSARSHDLLSEVNVTRDLRDLCSEHVHCVICASSYAFGRNIGNKTAGMNILGQLSLH